MKPIPTLTKEDTAQRSRERSFLPKLITQRVFVKLHSKYFRNAVNTSGTSSPSISPPPCKRGGGRGVGFLHYSLLITLFFLTGCGATLEQVIPTERPTVTPTHTPTPTRTPGPDAPTNTRAPITATGGPSPTPLLGATSTSAVAANTTPTRPPNPNAPRIEFFTSDSILGVAPGSTLTLFWSTRGADNAVIYRLDAGGQPALLWNVPPDGSLAISTRRSDRGSLTFVLTVGDGELRTESTLVIPLACPDTWFFVPAPDACPSAPAQPTRLLEEPFERGRMLYIEQLDSVYVLFNDGQTPAWINFDNRYDPTIHPESEDSFVPPPGFYQPVAILGFLWRGNDTVRTRLGLALQPQSDYEGFLQTVPAGTEVEMYVSSGDGSVLLLLPDGESWQIIAPPAP